jgi:hypothetical protein
MTLDGDWNLMTELIVAFARSGTASLGFNVRFRYNAALVVASARSFFASTRRRRHLNSELLYYILYNI